MNLLSSPDDEVVALRLLPLLLFALSLATGAAAAEPRIALVIGNGAYARIGALPNPPADARLIAGTVEALGFQTTLLVDADQAGMKQEIAAFGRKLRASGPTTVGLFYYAGHGVQAQGRNYLLPVEAAPTDQADLDLMGVEANWVLRQMESAGNSTNVIVLDACRNNPFTASNRAISKGLARIDAPTGSFIAYATAPGDVALDGEGVNSPFTVALAEALPTPGLPIEQLFKKVRVDVLQATEGRQTPWDSSSLVSDFAFAGEAADGGGNAGGSAQAAPRPVELSLWQSVSNSGDPGRLALFLQVYPDSQFAPTARSLLSEAMTQNPSLVIGPKIGTDQINALHDAPTPAKQPRDVVAAAVPSEHELIGLAQASGAAEDYRAYLSAYPDGVFADLARAEVAHLDDVAQSSGAGTGAPAQQAALPAASMETAVLFDMPLATDDRGGAPRSIHQLSQSSPAFPPVEGLRRDYWAEKTCSNCHNWTRDNLCRQGGFYAETDPSALARIKHPFGGFFKGALKKWAADGCK